MDRLTREEKKLIQSILTETTKYNLDNISRTNAYLQYYLMHKEIQWAFLAHMVSRNAGWNMCDLEGNWFPYLIKDSIRFQLFLTYERANWLIFQDVYPQLLLYEYSKKIGYPMFHLLKYFHISSFMEKEWNQYWHDRNSKRLLYSLIINEQHVIHEPVVNHPFYRKRIFHSWFFRFQDMFHFSTVLLPTCNGSLYGVSVTGFQNVHKRIDLGKRIAAILFNRKFFPSFYEFAIETVHTGSRYDYEYYFMKKTKRDTPILRMIFPIISHERHNYEDWSKGKKVPKKWFKEPVQHEEILLTEWFRHKQKQIRRLALLKRVLID